MRAMSWPLNTPLRRELALAARKADGVVKSPSVESSSAAGMSSTHTAQLVLATLWPSPRAASQPR
ncbi:hypothetical protein FQZ97_989890 [compost metagenome]